MNLTSSCRPFQVLQFHIAPSSCQCMLAIARLLTRPEALSNSNCWSLVGQQLWQGDFLRLKDSRRQMPYMWLSSLKIVSISYKAECHMYSWCKIEYIIELHIQYFHGKSDPEWLGVTRTCSRETDEKFAKACMLAKLCTFAAEEVPAPPARTKGSVVTCCMLVVLRNNLLSVVNSKFLSFAKAVISGITVTGAILHLQGVMAWPRGASSLGILPALFIYCSWEVVGTAKPGGGQRSPSSGNGCWSCPTVEGVKKARWTWPTCCVPL